MTAADDVQERLYALLPAVYRVRDAEQSDSLRALLGVMERTLDVLEGDLERLYDNWFIESCDEWIVPYLGDLLGVRGLQAAEGGAFSLRSFVANTLAFRQAKGTAAVLERVARAVTGWPSAAVEFFALLSTTQHVNHVRRASTSTVDLRSATRLERLGGPFESATHVAEVRHVDIGRGKYNIPNVGIFLWRLQSYFVLRGRAHQVDTPPLGRYRFNPLGIDAPLFHRARTDTSPYDRVTELDVPAPLRRRALSAELENLRQARVDGGEGRRAYFGTQPVLEVFVQSSPTDQPVQVPAEAIVICDLRDPPSDTDWRRPPASLPYTRATDGATVNMPIQVAVDPVLGRLAFPAGVTPNKVEVSYTYGCSGDLGGGPYDRRASVATWLRDVTFQIGVSSAGPSPAATGGQVVDSITRAVDAWHQYLTTDLPGRSSTDPAPFGVIAIMDSETYAETLPPVQVPAGATLAIVAADWPSIDDPNQVLGRRRMPGQVVPDNVRPHLRGDVRLRGTAARTDARPGSVILDGLLVEGQLRVESGNLGDLTIAHCTLLPRAGGVQVASGNAVLAIAIQRSIVGPFSSADSAVRELSVSDSLVDAGTGEAIVAPTAACTVDRSTIVGTAELDSLRTGSSIWLGVANVTRRQLGCARYTYLPRASLAPRRFRCQPAGRGAATPRFTSLQYGQPGYGQLRADCPTEISTGAEDGGEMGAFNFLQQARRLSNLRVALDDYLRFGLEAGAFFVN